MPGKQAKILSSDQINDLLLFATTTRSAADIADGVERNSRTVVTPRSGWLLIALARLLPSVVDRQLEKIYHKEAAGA